MWDALPQFQGYLQHDVDEFLRAFLDAVLEDESSAKTTAASAAAASASMKRQDESFATILRSLVYIYIYFF